MTSLRPFSSPSSTSAVTSQEKRLAPLAANLITGSETRLMSQHQNPARCDIPSFGGYFLGLEVPRSCSFPGWAARDLLDRASKKGKGQQAKKGKGQQAVLIRALYRGKEPHLAFKAGGNEMAQLKIPTSGIVTASEKYTSAHSKHAGICFFVLKWDKLPTDTDSESDNVNYRRKGNASPLPARVPPGTNYGRLPEIGQALRTSLDHYKVILKPIQFAANCCHMSRATWTDHQAKENHSSVAAICAILHFS